ncbi:MAG: hypothetical protein RLZZ292_2191 [Bacteroidota bacterium]|jgi:hypothetical protein
MIQRPPSTEYAHFYGTYIRTVPEAIDIVALMDTSMKELVAFFKTVEKSKANYRYAPEKWTIKEVLIHLIDTERIMAYRALRFARYDKAPLHGFDENEYVAAVNVTRRSVTSLLREYAAVRKASILLFKNFTIKQTENTGFANNMLISVRALAYIIVGHQYHHTNILKERYL